MNLIKQVLPLIAEAYHCAETPEGQLMTLEEVSERLVALAEKEQHIQIAATEDSLFETSENLNIEYAKRRFALYAWIDEKMLTSSRPDAGSWIKYSLQWRFFKTSSAGHLFYKNMQDQLDQIGIPSKNDDKIYTLAERLDLVDLLKSENALYDTLRVYTSCIVLGFKGELYNNEAELKLLKKVCKKICIPVYKNKRQLHIEVKKKTLFEVAQPFLWLLAPPLVTFFFYIWCSNIVFNLP